MCMYVLEVMERPAQVPVRIAGHNNNLPSVTIGHEVAMCSGTFFILWNIAGSIAMNKKQGL